MAFCIAILCQRRSAIVPSSPLRDTRPAGNINICASLSKASSNFTDASLDCLPCLLTPRNMDCSGFIYVRRSFTTNRTSRLSSYPLDTKSANIRPSSPPNGWLEVIIYRLSSFGNSPITLYVTPSSSKAPRQKSTPSRPALL